MRNKLIVGASLLIMGTAALAEPLKEAVYLVCKNFETGEAVGSISVVKAGLKIKVLDSEKVLEWQEIDLLRKVSEELAP